jgi:hypothetical protein
MHSDTDITVAVITSIQCKGSNTISKKGISVDVKLDIGARVTVWDVEALSHTNCELIKGCLLGEEVGRSASPNTALNLLAPELFF